jgi:hypothetical protein
MSVPGGNDHERSKHQRVVEIPMTSVFKQVWMPAVLVVEKSLQFVAVVAAAVALAAPAHADVDTDFANQLHGYGVYGPRDYNAWLGKLTCNRLGTASTPMPTGPRRSCPRTSHGAPPRRRRGNS